MNVKAAIYSMLASRSVPLKEVVSRLTYTKKTVYNAVEQMVKDGDLRSERRHNGVLVISIPQDFYHQRLGELHLLLITHGIDPTPLLSSTCRSIWGSITMDEMTAEQISQKTGFAAVTVRKYLRLLAAADALIITQKKPYAVRKNDSSEPAHLLEDIMGAAKTEGDSIFIPGSRPFEERLLSPEDLTRYLYDYPERSMSVTGTGFQLKGEGQHIAFESTKERQNIEQMFLYSLFSTVGVEERCLWILGSKKMDMKKLLDYAQQQDMVNIVGCYLNIIHDLRADIVGEKTIDLFYKASRKHRHVFLKELEKYGKQGWETPYETYWNIDLYLDLGAIRHGARAI